MISTLQPKCWRGPPGSGKRRTLQAALAAWCISLGQHYVLKRQLWDAPLQGGEETGDADADAAADAAAAADAKSLLPMECSTLHWGFDVARMSLQDKQYIRTILARWGRGSHVAGHSRCLVFYNAHLLSSESILFLQAFLEENYRDTVLWLTSEHPLPPRLSDWFQEISMKAGPMASIINSEITEIYRAWMETPATLSDVKRIRAVVYALLHRNLRWTDGFHQWMFALDTVPLTPAQRAATAAVCVSQPFTGPGQTVPSYRIPVLWEQYLISLRDALAPVAKPVLATPVVATLTPSKSRAKGKVLTSKKASNAAASNAAAVTRS
jgi:hypothetical protein